MKTPSWLIFNLVSTVTATCFSAGLLLRQPALVPGTIQPRVHNFALLVTLHEVSVAPVFKFLKVLSTKAPLFGLRTTPSRLVLSENLLQVHPVSSSKLQRR